jgi:hypothetical protein
VNYTCKIQHISLSESSAGVKTALEPTKIALRREQNNYLVPGIRSSPYIRSQYDIFESKSDSKEKLTLNEIMETIPAGMVFGWMKYDL